MNVFAFDIETVPDTEGARRLHDLEGLNDADVARALFARRRHQTGESEFLPLHLHRIVAIAAVLRSGTTFNVWSLGTPESDEAELIGRFFDGVQRYTPTLVSWNGSGFDLPVLHYRALLHGIAAPRYWDTGEEDREFRWNNYLNRYHWRHTDLMDVLSGYQLRAAAPLDELALLLGFPGKLGMAGSAVWDHYLEGRLGEIRDYCETDALNTYLIYLRWELIRGNLDAGAFRSECALVRAELEREGKPHWQRFLQAWHEHGGGESSVHDD